jgi:predicted TIM-barrel fold metal-dependent hydrolase
VTTRRNFLKSGVSAAAVAFCGCSMQSKRVAVRPKRRDLPVRINGEVIRTIDVHAHCQIPEVRDLIGPERWSSLNPITVNRVTDIVISVEQRFQIMDSQAIDMQVLSINPFWYADERDLAAAIVNLHNQQLAALCAAHPARFAAFASLTLQFPDLAVSQLEHAVENLGMRGAAIGGHVAGINFSDRRFDPVWRKAQELDVILFIHPSGIPELNRRLAGSGYLSNLIGNPLETSIALAHLIFDGTLDRFPNLKFLAAHGGGYLASYPDRSDHICTLSPTSCNQTIQLQKEPSEYLRQIYYDSLVFTPEALRHLVANVGSSQIFLGTDCPYPWQPHPVDHVFDTETLSDQQRAAILGGNAKRVLRL